MSRTIGFKLNRSPSANTTRDVQMYQDWLRSKKREEQAKREARARSDWEFFKASPTKFIDEGD